MLQQRPEGQRITQVHLNTLSSPLLSLVPWSAGAQTARRWTPGTPTGGDLLAEHNIYRSARREMEEIRFWRSRRLSHLRGLLSIKRGDRQRPLAARPLDRNQEVASYPKICFSTFTFNSHSHCNLYWVILLFLFVCFMCSFSIALVEFHHLLWFFSVTWSQQSPQKIACYTSTFTVFFFLITL